MIGLFVAKAGILFQESLHILPGGYGDDFYISFDHLTILCLQSVRYHT